MHNVSWFIRAISTHSQKSSVSVTASVLMTPNLLISQSMIRIIWGEKICWGEQGCRTRARREIATDGKDASRAISINPTYRYSYIEPRIFFNLIVECMSFTGNSRGYVGSRGARRAEGPGQTAGKSILKRRPAP